MAKTRGLFVISWVWLGGLLLIFLSLHTSPTAGADSQVEFCFGEQGTLPKTPPVIQVTEGKPATFTVYLCKQPTANVQLISAIRDSQDMTDTTQSGLLVEPLTLDITRTQSNQPVTVTITANKNNDTYDPPLVYSLFYEARSNDANYDWVSRGPWAQITILNDDLTPVNYLPNIRLDPTPTPPPPQWQQFANSSGLDLDVVQLHQNRIFLGDKSVGATKGIYEDQQSTCATNATFRPIHNQSSIRDLFFRGNFGLAASFGNKALYSTDIVNTWQATTSGMNQFVYGVVKATNNRSYAGTDVGVYESNDDGKNWQPLKPAGAANPTVVNGFAYRDSDADFLWVATFGNGVARYQLSNNTVVAYSNGLSTTTAKQVLDIALRNNEVYIGTMNGVYKGTTDTNTAWTPFGLSNLQVVSLEVVGNTLYAGTNKQGIYVRDLSSGDWVKQTTPLDGNVIRDLLYDESGLCKNSAANRNGLLAATDNGLWIYR